ncbi:MAG: Sua5 YciO YrdC YwlC family protein [Campylobacterota bacterium]|nr:Sua5 YciO YrdC YwlC family protein [Campylobacterota bacterium]
MATSLFKDLVFLTQTDTTIGFVSQNASKISQIKQRPAHKNYIKALPSLKTLKAHTRVPTKHKNRVRRAKRTSFIIQGNSYRVIKNHPHTLLLERLGWAYTSSANLSGKEYDEVFAKGSADVVVSFPKNHQKRQASKIYQLSNNRLKRVR